MVCSCTHGVLTALKKVEAKRELLRTKRRMSQMMQLPSDDADTNSESLPRTCPPHPATGGVNGAARHQHDRVTHQQSPA